MTSPGADSRAVDSGRRLTWPGLVALLIAFVLAPALFDVVVLHRDAGDAFPDLASVRSLVAGQVLALVVVLGAVTWLHWWPQVVHEESRVRRWVWALPAVFLVLSVALTDYGRLSTAGPAVTVTLLAYCLLIATSEEVMFRGLVLTFLRQRYREVPSAVLASVLFGLAHFPAGVLNVIASCLMGYLLYYVRRVSGGLLVPVAVHALYDFAVYSSLTTNDPDLEGNASPALFLTTVLATLLLVALHRTAEPTPPTDDRR